jgi:hypothetical protein
MFLKGTVQQDLSAESDIIRTLLQAEMLRFSADFSHPLSRKRPFKFLCHLLHALGVNGMISMSDSNYLWRHIKGAKQTWKQNRTWEPTIHGHGHEHELEQGHGIRVLLLSI